MRIQLLAAAAGLTVAFVSLPAAWGQGSSSSGMFGSRSMGSGLSPGGMGGSTSSNTLNLQASGTTVNTANFTPQGPGQFVGNSAATSQAALAGESYVGTNGMNSQSMMRSGSGSGFGMSQQMGNQVGMQGPAFVPPFPAALSMDFDHPMTASTVGLGNLAKRIANARGIKTPAPLQLTVEGRTAILRGAVASEHDRLLVEQVARLEPGIWAVRNELTVGSPGTRQSPTRVSPDRQPGSKPVPPPLTSPSTR